MLTRDNAHAADVFDALTARRDPGRDRRPLGAAPAARGGRGASPRCTLLHDLTANAELLTLLTGPRWAIGPRDLRAARAARPRARRRGQRARSGRDVGRASAWPRRSPAPTRPRSPSLCRRAGRPGRRCAYSRGGARALRPARRRAAAAARPRRRAAARPGPPDHRHLRHRRRARLRRSARRRRPGATTSTCSSRRSRSSRPIDGDGDPAGAAGLPRRRGRAGQRPRRRHPDRGRLGQAAHRAPRQGPGVGRGLPGRASARAVPAAPARRSLWTDRRLRCCRRRCAATPATCRSCAGHDKAALERLRDRRPGARGDRGAAARATSPSPAPGTGSSVSSYLLDRDAARRRSARRPTSRSCATLVAGWGERAAAWLDKPAEGHAQPAAGDVARGALAGDRADRGGAAPARGRRAGRGRVDRPGARTPALDMVEAAPGRRVGRRARAAARRGAPRPGADVVDVPLPSSLSATALARLRDDPDALRPRAGPADAAAALAGRAVRHPLPRLGGGPLRPAGPASTPTSCPAAPTPASTTTTTSRELIGRFEAGPVRRPGARTRVEAPFALVLAGQVVRGRIDAVYARAATAASWSSTGRPTGRPPPTRSSSRSTGWPGPSSPACRSSGCARRSTTCAPASSSSRPTSPTGPDAARRWPGATRRPQPGRGRRPGAAARAISTMVAEGLLALLGAWSPRR